MEVLHIGVKRMNFGTITNFNVIAVPELVTGRHRPLQKSIWEEIAKEQKSGIQADI